MHQPKQEKLTGKDRALVGLVGLLFILYLLESYLGHFALLTGRSSWGPWVPVVYALMGFLAVAAMLLKPAGVTWWVFRLTLWGGIGVAALGIFFHAGLSPMQHALSETGWIIAPPLVAPLSFLIPVILGLVGVSRETLPREEKRVFFSI